MCEQLLKTSCLQRTLVVLTLGIHHTPLSPGSCTLMSSGHDALISVNQNPWSSGDRETRDPSETRQTLSWMFVGNVGSVSKEQREYILQQAFPVSDLF